MLADIRLEDILQVQRIPVLARSQGLPYIQTGLIGLIKKFRTGFTTSLDFALVLTRYYSPHSPLTFDAINPVV